VQAVALLADLVQVSLVVLVAAVMETDVVGHIYSQVGKEIHLPQHQVKAMLAEMDL
jgi:hypothetical protein